MIQKVVNTIEEYNMLNSDDKVIVGVSGGPDSLVLLHILKHLQHKYNIKVYAVHINHKLRGEESEQDQNFVRDICEKWDIPLYEESIDVYGISKDQKQSIEVAGRESRYKIFNKVLKQLNAQKIAVAHNSDDNAETVLMRLLRGTGTEGLGGIKPVRESIIRPLICIERDEILNYCKHNNINVRIDSSNLETIYTRNKVRLELIPYLKKEFNPNVINTINKMSKVITLENEFLNKQANKILDRVIKEQNKEYISINLDKIKTQSVFILPRVIRCVIERLLGSLEGFSYANFDDIVDFINNAKTGSVLNLPKGLILKKDYKKIIISKQINKIKSKKFSYNIQIPGKTFINETGDIIEASLINANEAVKTDKFTKKFDFGKINSDIYIRTRENGDIINPSGMRGTKKLKDFFIDKKIPREKRDNIPIVVLDKEVLWVVGHRTSNKYKVDNNTEKILLLKYIKK